MKRKNRSYSQYSQSMFNKYSIDDSYLQTGKQRRACLELLEKIDTNQKIDDKSMIEKLAAAFQGTEFHKKVVSCITVAALLAVLQSTPAMAQASKDYQPKTEAPYSELLPANNSVQLDSDSYLGLAASSAHRDIKSSSLHLFSNKTLANDYVPLQPNGVIIDDDSDVSMFPAQETITLTVIDTGLVDWKILKDAVKEGEILLLDDETDPLEAILAKLQEMGTVDCINIISHGESGKLKFENSVIDSAALETSSDKWIVIGSYLSGDGDIQLYGCNIAKGDAGKAFIEKLAKITGADVAASINPTGSESKGGDWTLEAVVGDVTGNLPFAKDAIGKFMSILLPSGGIFTFTGTTGDFTFGDPGDMLTNNYFTASAVFMATLGDPGVPVPMNISGSYAFVNHNSTSGSFQIKISTDASKQKSFELENISISNADSSYLFSNLEIKGHKTDGTGFVTANRYYIYNTGTYNGTDFSGFYNFDGVQLDYFIIQSDSNIQTPVKFHFNSFNVSNMTAAAPTATIAAQTVKGGANVSVQSSATGTVYLVSSLLADTAIDSVGELDTLVTGGAATKATITVANTDTSISAPSAEGTYAAVAVDSSNNISGKSTNLVTVDNTAPTASIVVSDNAIKIGETATVTITFSEAVTGFTDANLTAMNGSLSFVSSSDNKTWTATLTPSASIEVANNKITLDLSGVTDTAGNEGSGTVDSNNYAIDTKHPTASIVVSDTTLTAGETSLVTITFSEPVTGFTNEDLTIENGTLSLVSSSDGGKTWTATLTPATNIEDATNVIKLNKIGVEDLAGNAGRETVDSNNYEIDTRVPSATIAVSDTALRIGETATVTITFSEPVTGFTNDDLTVANGTLSDVMTSDGGKTWSAIFIPSDDVEDTSNIITLDQTGVANGVGNAGVGTANSNNYTIDTKRPSASVVVSDNALAAGETSLVTITFSEAVTGFTNADLTVENGTLSSVSSSDGGTTWVAIFTPTADFEDTANVITLDQAGVVDTAGNAGSGTVDSNNYVIDTKRPTASIEVSDTTLAAGKTSLVTITFSEAVTGFTNGDLTIANGTLTAASSADGGKTWTATFTPTANIAEATNVITLNQAGVMDIAGNTGIGTVDSNNYAINTVRPTASIAISDTTFRVGETATVTITFSETVTGFSNADLTVANGTLSTVSSSDGGKTWTATFTPTADIEDTSNIITLDQTGVMNSAENTGVGTAASNNYTIDTKRPTATIAVSDTTIKIGETATVTITFSEAVTGLTTADLTAANGTLSSLSSSDGGKTWTVTITPTANIEDTSNVITLDQTGMQDMKGNAGIGAVDSNNYSIDTKRPTASIMVSDTTLTAGETSLVTITFSEAVTGFTNADLTVANGTLSDVISADGGTTWTATFTPTEIISDTTNVISLDQAGVADTAGNAGIGTVDSNNYAIDTVRPTASIVVSDNALAAGETSPVTIAFSEPVTGFTNADLTIANGTLSAVTTSDGGKTWTATFTPDADVEDTSNVITLDQTGVANGAGNAGVGIVDSNNYTIDTKRPSASIVVGDTSLTAGETSLVTITFSEPVTGFTNADLTIANGTLSAVSSSDGGKTWIATLTPTADIEDTSNVITLDQAGVTDTAGNAGSGTVDSNDFAIDTKRPTVVSVTVPGNGKYTAGSTLDFNVTFDEVVTVDTTAGTPGISLTIGGSIVNANYTAGNGSTVLKFSYTITDGQMDTDGISLGALTLNNGTIEDALGSAATLTLNNVDSTADVIVDTTSPTISAGTITVSDLTTGSAKLTWAKAADTVTAQADLKYKVVYSTSTITTVDAAESATQVQNWTSDISTCTVTGLNPGTDYYFNVLVKDEAGNKSLYTAVTGKTAANTTSGGGNSSSDSPSGIGVVEVNGEKQDAGSTSTRTTGGQTTTTIIVDSTKLNKILESKGENATVTLPAGGNPDVVVGELNGQTVKYMEQKEAILEIKTPTVTYALPASQINIDDVSAQIGSQVELKDIKVSVRIAEPSADTVKIVENTANKNSYQIVVKPIDFEINCSSGGKTIEVSKFNGYVERTIAIPDGIDPRKITTGIVLNPDGTFSHVPTQITVINGKYFARINSLTNSTYSVIWNPVEFNDVVNYWAQAAINDMGSRMVVTGVGNGNYDPARSITRAEFAAIVVRALGLTKGSNESSFGDVSLNDWFNGYVDTSTAYSLITGYDSASFGPNDTITREQAMAILARAMKLTGLDVSLTESETSTLLAKFTDGASVSGYARTSAAMCLKSGVVTGSSATALSPKSDVTRAEVAVMVQRLLKKSGLI